MLECNLDKLPFKIDDWAILNRCMQHDLDKFKRHNADRYVKIEEYYSNRRNNIDNGYIDKDKLYDCCEDHYKSQRHHTAYHKANSEPYTDVDICEMCCDIAAQSIRNNDKTFGKDYVVNTLIPNNSDLNNHKNNIIQILNLLAQLYSL